MPCILGANVEIAFGCRGHPADLSGAHTAGPSDLTAASMPPRLGLARERPMELDVACALVPRKFTEFGHDLRRSDFCRAASYDLFSEAISSGQEASGTELQSN
jgi:hypothetical protein